MWEMGKQSSGNGEKLTKTPLLPKQWRSCCLTDMQVALMDATAVILLSSFICSKITQLNE